MAHLLTCAQVRAARAMLKWRIVDLAECAQVSENTIRTVESGEGIPNVGARVLNRIEVCFRNEGFLFLDDDGTHGPGVRFNPTKKS